MCYDKFTYLLAELVILIGASKQNTEKMAIAGNLKKGLFLVFIQKKVRIFGIANL